MRRPPSGCHLLFFLLSPLSAVAQNFAPLDFSHSVQTPNAIYPAGYSRIGPAYYNQPTIDFLNVTTMGGQAIDARLSVTNVSGNYVLDGWVPYYNGPVTGTSNDIYPDNQLESDRGDDLGIFYHSLESSMENVGGLSWTLTFYQGGGLFQDTVVLDSIALLLYDHDGEPGQSEALRTHVSDGFAGYMVRNDSGILAADEGSSFLFQAGGIGKSELTSAGGIILNYRNVDSLRIDMLATTSPGIPYTSSGILLAIDGDLDLVNPADFGAYVAVPEPGPAAMAGTALALMLLRRHRRNG
jgi:hypothetical protein